MDNGLLCASPHSRCWGLRRFLPLEAARKRALGHGVASRSSLRFRELALCAQLHSTQRALIFTAVRSDFGAVSHPALPRKRAMAVRPTQPSHSGCASSSLSRSRVARLPTPVQVACLLTNGMASQRCWFQAPLQRPTPNSCIEPALLGHQSLAPAQGQAPEPWQVPQQTSALRTQVQQAQNNETQRLRLPAQCAALRRSLFERSVYVSSTHSTFPSHCSRAVLSPFAHGFNTAGFRGPGCHS